MSGEVEAFRAGVPEVSLLDDPDEVRLDKLGVCSVGDKVGRPMEAGEAFERLERPSSLRQLGQQMIVADRLEGKKLFGARQLQSAWPKPQSGDRQSFVTRSGGFRSRDRMGSDSSHHYRWTAERTASSVAGPLFPLCDVVCEEGQAMKA